MFGKKCEKHQEKLCQTSMIWEKIVKIGLPLSLPIFDTVHIIPGSLHWMSLASPPTSPSFSSFPISSHHESPTSQKLDKAVAVFDLTGIIIIIIIIIIINHKPVSVSSTSTSSVCWPLARQNRQPRTSNQTRRSSDQPPAP